MTRDQAKAYLKSSGFTDLQISEIEKAFIVDFLFNSYMGVKKMCREENAGGCEE